MTTRLTHAQRAALAEARRRGAVHRRWPGGTEGYDVRTLRSLVRRGLLREHAARSAMHLPYYVPADR